MYSAGNDPAFKQTLLVTKTFQINGTFCTGLFSHCSDIIPRLNPSKIHYGVSDENIYFHETYSLPSGFGSGDSNDRHGTGRSKGRGQGRRRRRKEA
jgi:hypothetical protein